MYIVGHWVVTELSGVFDTITPGADGAVALMFPDYATCHDWGYDCCFEPWWYGAPPGARMLQAHLLGDYFVHYGVPAAERTRSGWAYRRMGFYAARYDRFFADAARRGLCDAGPPADTLRGFSHSMTEYTIDTYLARRGYFDRPFDYVQKALGMVDVQCALDIRASAAAALPDVPEMSAALGVSVDSFAERVRASREPDEFAFYAGIRKFRLRSCDEARQIIDDLITEGIEAIGPAAIESFVADCAAFLATHMTRGTEETWT